MSRLPWIGPVLTVALAAGCARESAWPPQPAELRAGEDVCSECRMFVTDARFAAQRHSTDGEVEWFDDLGCLLSKYEQGVEPESVFVRDVERELWVRGDLGHAVHVPGLDTPMGHGWIVHASEAAAQVAERAAGAQRLPLSELLLHGSSVERRNVIATPPSRKNPGEE